MKRTIPGHVEQNAGRPGRRGAVLVKVALLMPVMIGMLGLVLDTGLLMATHRQTRNAADAAALAVAMDAVRGKTWVEAEATGLRFVRTHNALADAAVAFHHPPVNGAYKGRDNFVEVIVTVPVETLFIQVLGVNRSRTVRGRAVAGFRPVSAGDGVMVLDRMANPGLRTSNNASIWVNGRITVNSESGGIDENGNTLPQGGTAAVAGSNAWDKGIHGTDIRVVGGVNNLSAFYGMEQGDPSPLRCRQLPEPDPLMSLPTPTTANGVYNINHGSYSTQSTKLPDMAPGSVTTLTNFKATVDGQVFGIPVKKDQIILFPGIYENINISGTGTSVIFMPGIYVLAPVKSSDNFKITGGTVVGRGVMIYHTHSGFNPADGTPDKNDGEQVPARETSTGIEINSQVELAPIDTKTYNYAGMYPNGLSVSDAFDGMLFYQRRMNSKSIKIVGGKSDEFSPVKLTGTLYAKWATFDISGQGGYDAQFICGSMDVTGQGSVTILAAGKERGKANQVFLVE